MRSYLIFLFAYSLFTPAAWSASVVTPDNISSHGQMQLCAGRTIEVVGDGEEATLVCPALLSVLEYFGAKGIEFPMRDVKVVFSPWLKIKIPGLDEALNVHGLYDSSTNIVYLSNAEEQKDRKPFGLVWDHRFLRSYLEHELTHFLVVSKLMDSRKLTPAWHEFLAYTTQIALLPQDLKEKALLGQKPLEERRLVTNLIYGLDPEGFATRSYLGLEALGGDALLRELLSGTNPSFSLDVEL